MLVAEETGEPAETSEANNHITFSATGVSLDGSEAAWRANRNYTSDFRGGVDSMHFEQALGDGWFFDMDGRGIFDEDEYSFTAVLEKPGFNRTTFGFENYRYWSDARTVDIPGSPLIELIDPSLHLDRSKFYIETTFYPSDVLDLTARYTYRERDGEKASTSWGDSTYNGRKTVPSFWDIDETHHTVELEAERRWESTTLDGALRYDHAEVDDSRTMSRGYDGASERFIKHAEKTETDTVSAHGGIEHRVSEKLMLSMSALYSRLDGDVSGNRIYGDTLYDPIFGSVNVSGYDHGFLDLAGDFDYDQYVATFGALYQPADDWFVTPSLRFESTSQDGNTVETETGGAAIHDDIATDSEKDYNSVAAELGARYTGITNWTFYGDAFGSYGEGDLFEKQYVVGDPLNPSLERDTDFERGKAKFTLGANWFAHRRLSVAFQAYHRYSENDYDNGGLNPADYSAYLTEQVTSTNAANVRFNWRVLSNLTSITRFDYSESTIDSAFMEQSDIETADLQRFGVGQSLSYQPCSSVTLIGSVNYYQDHMSTPASDAFGSDSTAVVADSENDYITGDLTAFYMYDESLDFTANVGGLISDNYYDNSAVSTPYGNDIREYHLTLGLNKKLSSNKRVSIEYGYYDFEDDATSERDYDAHVITAKYEYRF